MEQQEITLMNNISKLNNEFNAIKNMGWIKEMRKGPTNIGYTFETLLGKKEDYNDTPDYEGIEIKTKKNDKFMTLFCCCLYSEEKSQAKRILEKYGYPDKKIKQFKNLRGDIICTNYQKIGHRYLYKLKIDKNEGKIYLVIIDPVNGVMDKNSYWTFDQLRVRLNKKLKYLAFIKVKTKFFNNLQYTMYESIQFYKLKNFNQFISLIEQDKIKVVINIGFYKSQDKFGKICDHGTSFRLDIKYLNELFDRIYI